MRALITPNAYADAVAKGALAVQPEVNLIEGVAACVWARPCIYERDRGYGEGWELCNYVATMGQAALRRHAATG